MKNESSKDTIKQPAVPDPVPDPVPEAVPKPAPAFVPPVTNTVQPTNGLAVAAMVVGIVALVLAWVPFVGFAGGIAAIVLGIIALKKTSGKGMSIAGIVTGAISILCGLVIAFMFFASLAILGGVAVEGGKVATEINKAATNYNKEQQEMIDAKKDFSKGQTAVFGNFEVKANSVQRNYVPEDSYSAAGEGKELVVVNVTVKNIDTKSNPFSSYDLSLNADGVASTTSYLTVNPEFTGGDLSAGATTSGNIVYEIAKGASSLKLQYEENVYDLKNSELKTLTYTLAI